MFKSITKFFVLIEKLSKENASVLLLLSFLFNVLLCWLLYKVYKWFRKEQKKLESERKKFNDEKIDKVKIEGKLAISNLQVVELEKQLQESENREEKLQNKLDIASEKISYLKEKNAELEANWKNREIEDLKKKIEELQKTNRKNKN